MFLPGDIVIRTKYCAGMVGQLIYAKASGGWIVRVTQLAPSRTRNPWDDSFIGEEQGWDEHYFELVERQGPPSWEV
jgi:hypothetical protein